MVVGPHGARDEDPAVEADLLLGEKSQRLILDDTVRRVIEVRRVLEVREKR